MAIQINDFVASLLKKGETLPATMRTAGWTVGRKLLLGFGVVSLLIAVMAGMGFAATMAIQKSFEKVAQDTLVELETLAEIKTLAVGLLGETQAYVLFGEEYDLEEVKEVAKEVSEAVESYASAGTELDAEEEEAAELEIMDRLQAAVADLTAKSAEMIALYEEGVGEEELEEAGEKLEEAEIVLEAVLEEAEEALDEEVEEVTAAVRTLVAGAQMLLVIFPISVLALTLGVGYLLNRSIVNPVRNLTETTHRIAAGDLDQAADVTSKDEIGMLAQAFNSMTARLREMLHSGEEQRLEIEQRVAAERGLREHLQRIFAQAHKVANDLSSASAEILAATTQQASGASEQSAAIAQTTTTVDELKTIAEQSVARAQEVAGASQRTVEVSHTGRQTVQDTIASMAQIKARVEGIAENILVLSEQTQQIGEIIATVNDIAAQSNILALNASVEAARAGEYGKGFAVVAVEVRNLAEQSRQATAQIKAILSDIQKATNLTVMATEEGTKRVDEGVRLAAQTGEAIEQLAAVIQESAQAAAQMVAGGRQQASGVEQVALAMQNINQATVQSLESTRQAEKAARDLNELARGLTGIVEQYRL